MNMDSELDIWREQWQAQAPVPLDLRRKVERQTRFLKMGLLADILVTIVIGGGVILWAVRSPQSDILLLAAVTWFFLAAAWTFTWTVTRRSWSPPALSTAAFIDLSIRRCRARLAAVRFGAVLFLCNTGFCLAWVYRHADAPRQPFLQWLLFSSLPIDIVWLCTLMFFVFLFWYRGRKRAELSYLLTLQESASQ